MEKIFVAIMEEDGITTGELIKAEPELGQVVTLKSTDENGVPFLRTSVCYDVK